MSCFFRTWVTLAIQIFLYSGEINQRHHCMINNVFLSLSPMCLFKIVPIKFLWKFLYNTGPEETLSLSTALSIYGTLFRPFCFLFFFLYLMCRVSYTNIFFSPCLPNILKFQNECRTSFIFVLRSRRLFIFIPCLF